MAQLPRPATVDIAAAEEDGTGWAESLDVDDSGLRLSPSPSSRPLRPSTAAAPDKPCPSHGQRIPGPASAFQDAMRLRVSGILPVSGRVDIQAANADFLLSPWLCALRFLGKERAWERPGIKRIKGDCELHRAPLVVGVVTSCKPNGLGDLFLTLKDPTDAISASVHRNVLSEENFGQDISVGCVIVLNKVAVFRPSRTACYLNITKGKVVKVVRKDYEPPLNQEILSGTTESQLPVMFNKTQRVEHLRDKPLRTSEGIASIFSRMVCGTKGSQVAELYSEGDTTSYSASQQMLNTLNSKNPDTGHERHGGSVPVFERGEAEGSANIIMGRLGHEKLMPGRNNNAVAKVSCHHQRTLDSSKSTSAHESSRYTDGRPKRSFNIPDTCSRPVPGGSSVIPGEIVCTQANNNVKPRLPLADELMLPSSRKRKINVALSDCSDVTMNSSLDTKSKHGSANNMDIDVHSMAEPFHGGHSTSKPDDHHQKDFYAANTGTAQPTKETSATDAAAVNNGPLLCDSKMATTGWTDEQISELFAGY